MSRCPMYGGEEAPGKRTFSVDLGTGVVVARNVSAKIRKQCDEDWIGPGTATAFGQIVQRAREARTEVGVVAM